ncbi:transposase [Inquilinus sp. CAU 1745]|uniref:transposase n=1 Tax=Inquilinus sp. CAU 1745 TaxID=3140369 RepID=UPI00325BD605
MSEASGLDWDDVLGRLDGLVDLEGSARSSGALRRRRLIRSADVLLRFCFAYVLGPLSFRGVSGWATQSGLADLSDVAVLKRLRNSADWLGHLVSHVLAARHPEAAAGLGDCRLVAVDATTVAPPGPKREYFRVHTVFDLTGLCFRTVEISDRREAERLDRGVVQPGEVRIADRAHANVAGMAAVRAAGGDFLVRMTARQPRLLDEVGDPLHRLTLCRAAGKDGLLDRPVTVAGGDRKRGQRLPARLTIWPLPPDAAEKAREAARRTARRTGYTASEAAIEMAGYLMLLSSLPVGQWPAERLLAAYRLRWQVELAFKRLKSIVGLERLRAKDPDVARAWINTALLASLLAELDMPDLDIEAPDSLPRASRIRQNP